MKFKVGDKVKVGVSFPNLNETGRICVITEIKPISSKFDYDIQEIDSLWSSPIYEHEVELCLRKGEQLLFSFMRQ